MLHVVLLTATYIIKLNHCESNRIQQALLHLFLLPHPEVQLTCSEVPRKLQQYLEQNEWCSGTLNNDPHGAVKLID